MIKYIFLFLSLAGLFAFTNKFPCHWVNPKRCTIYDLPKEPPPYFPLNNY